MRNRIIAIAALTVAILAPALGEGAVPSKDPKRPPVPVRPKARPVPATVPTPTPVVAPAISPGAAQWFNDRMRAHVAHKLSVAPRPQSLMAAGLSAENDFVERARTIGTQRVAAFHVGRATTVATPPPPQEVDPAIEQYARGVLRQRLRREPSNAEIDVELRAFDARVAQVNQALFKRHREIAAAMQKDGRFPRVTDGSLLGVQPADPQVQSGAALNGFLGVFARLIEAAAGPSIPEPATLPAVPATKPLNISK